MASQDPVDVDPKELERAENAWVSFGVASKWGVIFIIIILAGMGAAFL